MADMKCPECDGRGEYLDAPADVLDGTTYWQKCEACRGTGRVEDAVRSGRELMTI